MINNTNNFRSKILMLSVTLALAAGLGACSDDNNDDHQPAVQKQDRPLPLTLPAELMHEVGNADAGKEVFRYGTFGNESFWTQAVQLPQGIAAAKVTPLQALQLGLSVDVGALNKTTADAAVAAIAEITAGTTEPEDTIFGDPAITLALINQNAVIGVVAVDADGKRKPLGSSADYTGGALDAPDFENGEQVGVSCAVCHAQTDESVLPASALGTGGSIGLIADGATAHNFDFGTVLAVADNSLAYFPMLQLQFNALDGATIGRGFEGLKVTAEQQADPGLIGVEALEAKADEYLTGVSEATGQRFYPVGQFDAFPDGIANPLHTAAFFATEQGAPWGIDGAIEKLEDFNNTVFTVSLDPTSVAAPAGQAFLEAQAGGVGTEISTSYRAVLKASLGTESTPLTDAELDAMIPFVAAQDGLSPGDAASVAGRRIDSTSLLDLNAYLDSLPSPRAPDDIDQASADRGKEIFRTLAPNGGNCTSCHQVDPNQFVNPAVIAFETIYPAYADSLAVIAERTGGLAPIQNSGGADNMQGPNPFFDDRMVVLDGSRRGLAKGTSFPLLMDLAGKSSLLHDDSVQGTNFKDAADKLLDPARGEKAAHPFYIASADERNDVAEFLRSRETDEHPETDSSQGM